VPFPTNMAGITQLVSSGNAYAALDSGGKVYTWGCLDEGASLGDPNDPSSAASFINQKPIQKLFSNTTAFAALATDGTVISWGGSACRVSGASTYKDFFKSTFEAARSQLTNVVNVIDNYGSFVAVKSDGSFVAWGYANQEDLNSAGPQQPQTGILAFADYRTDETIVLTGTPQADQITISGSGGTALGFGGADTVIGSPNSDSLYGGAGDDSLIAGSGNDILLGEDGADNINGGDGSDILNGDTTPVASAVSTFALAAAVPASSDDSLVGGKDNDGINGGVGNDTAIYSGNRADYTVSYNSATQVFTVTDKVSNRDGTDTVRAVENFQFADGTKTAASLMVNVVTGTNNADTLTVLSGSN
jgi:Ca2+-binding RTX toxin-like protein